MKKLAFAFLPLFLLGCNFAPDAQRPEAPLAAHFKESAGWTPAEPADALPRDGWWRLFHDPELDHLETKLLETNLNLRQALARYDQARATAEAAGSQQYPALSLATGAERIQHHERAFARWYPGLKR